LINGLWAVNFIIFGGINRCLREWLEIQI